MPASGNRLAEIKSEVTSMTLRDQIEQAWCLRWNQKIESTMEKLAQIQLEMNWSDLFPDSLRTISNDLSEDYLNVLLLKGALLRAQGFRNKSSVELRKITNMWSNLDADKPFYLLFELALDHWVDHDIAKALEYFLLAEKKSKTSVQNVFSLSNVLWCLEALDLDFDQTFSKLEEKIKTLSSEDKSHCFHVLEQISAFKLRRHFYEKMKLDTSTHTGQAEFFQQWVGLLPYFSIKTELSLPNEYMWQGSYRLRTLARIWITQDSHVVRTGDAIERLYLWTWLLMANRTEMNQEKVILVLESVLKDFEMEQQCKDGLLLFRNSLGWLQILYPQIKNKVRTLYSKLEKLNSARYPVLEAEFDLIQHFTKDYGDHVTDKVFMAFAPFKKIFLEMKTSLPVLQEKLTPLMLKMRSYELVLDLGRGEIFFPQKGKRVSSSKLVNLLSRLEEQRQMSIEDVSELDIINLVYRARKMIGSECILMNKNTISRGPNWPKTLILNDVELTPYQMSMARPSFVESEAHTQAARALFPQKFKRKELEKKMLVSKSSANRMIESWLTQGMLAAEGKAKATTYYWSEV